MIICGLLKSIRYFLVPHGEGVSNDDKGDMWWLEIFDDDATQPIFDFFPLSFCRWSPIPVKVDILKGGIRPLSYRI